MKLSTPRWWYEEDGGPAGITRALLTPASWLWAWATARRIRTAKPFDPGVPVICVGNLTVGGTGKTPVVRAVLHSLRARGVGAEGLSRGYGGRLKGPIRVDPLKHAADDVGDEPLMLAATAPFWVARDRIAGATAAAQAGAEVLVLDDGHQNPSLKKALSLVVVDGETRGREWPFGDGSVFPAGPMREPLFAGLKRADAVVLMMPADLQTPDARLVGLFEPLPVLIARLTPDGPPPPGPQLGFAGVGKPWKVERALIAAGCDLKDFAPYPDHTPYSAADMGFLATRAATLNAGLVTTEKDWVRLSPDWRARVKAWPVTAKFDDEAALEALLDRVLTTPSNVSSPLRGEGMS
jgi:tetraacyldisaccharide 4'-kinase